VLVFFAAVFTVHRVGLETFGRQLNIYNFEQPEIMRLETVGELEKSGKVALYRGEEIKRLFFAHLPKNPLMVGQVRNLEIDHEKTYVITTETFYFQLLDHSIPELEVYEHPNRGYLDGSALPNVYVLKSDLSPETIVSKPVASIKYPEQPVAEKYLYLSNNYELDIFLDGPVPEEQFALILPEAETPYPDRFLDQITRFLNYGDEVIEVGPYDRLVGGEIYLTEYDLAQRKSRGFFKGFSSNFYSFAYLLLGLTVSFLGFYNQGKVVSWVLCAVLLSFMAPFYQLHRVITGLLSVAILKLGWLRKSRSLIWYFLAGILTFSLLYASFLLDPFAGVEQIIYGLILGGIIFINLPAGWRRRRPNFEDLTYWSFVALFFLFLMYPWAGGVEVEQFVRAAVLIFLPVFGWLFPRWGIKRHLLRLIGITGWLILFTQGVGVLYLFLFSVAIIAWEIELLYLNPEIVEQRFL